VHEKRKERGRNWKLNREKSKEILYNWEGCQRRAYGARSDPVSRGCTTFFGVHQHTKAETRFDNTALGHDRLNNNGRAQSVEHSNEDSSHAGWRLSSAPATQKSQRPSLPEPRNAFNMRFCDQQYSVTVHRTHVQHHVDTASGSQEQLDGQLSLSGSQLISGFVDDADLEAELNDPSLSQKTLHAMPTFNNIAASRLGTPSKKRKAEDMTQMTPRSSKTARVVFAQMSPSMLNSGAEDRAGTLSDSCLTISSSNHPAAALCPEDIPTASQVEAMFWSQEFEDDRVHSDKENFDLSAAPSISHQKSHIGKSSSAEAGEASRSAGKFPVMAKLPTKQSVSGV
jgi:hypothetical protein